MAQEIHEIVLKNVRLSYPYLFQAKKPGPNDKPGKKPTFSATAILDEKTQADQIKAAHAAMIKARDAFFPAAQRSGVKLPLRRGDEDGYVDKDGYGPGTRFIGANSTRKPRVIDMQKADLTEASGKPYGGCYVNMKIRFFGNTTDNIRRVCASVEVVQFYRDGTPFGAGPASIDDMDEEPQGDADVSLDGI